MMDVGRARPSSRMRRPAGTGSCLLGGRLNGLRESRVQPRLIVLHLFGRGPADGDDAGGGRGGRDELELKGAELVEAEDRERHGVARLALFEARAEEVAGGAV